MPELESDTHGLAVAAGASTTATDTTIGTVTMPAGGPWKIFQVWSTIAAATATAGECYGGYFRLNASSGDLTPNPAPSKFPTGILGSVLGATIDSSCNQTSVYDVEYEAAGKSVIDLIYHEQSAVTVATQVVLGIIFGKDRPVKVPFSFVDSVRAAVTSAADTSIGTITISEKASEIVAVCCVLAQDGVLTTGEELLGFFRLASDDVKMPPAQFPCGCGFSAGLGALINQAGMGIPYMIPVKIPVTGGARIDCFIDLNTAVTNAAEVEIYIAYR